MNKNTSITYDQAKSVNKHDWIIVKNKDLMLYVENIIITPTTIFFEASNIRVPHTEISMILK